MYASIHRHRFTASLVAALTTSVLVVVGALAHAVAQAQFYA